MKRRLWAALAVATAITASCSDGAKTAGNAPPNGTATGPTERCVVSLHGKGGDGAATSLRDGVATVAPRGNADGWGGRQWIYFPDSRFDAARSVVRAAIDAQGCAQVIVHGFSNGGAFAAKLACRGETFDGRVVGYVIDDPVVDHGVEPCAASPAGVARTLYWTGALAATAKPGWNCAEQDWTCDGGTTIGIDAYARALGVPVKPSRFRDHQPYDDAPELAAWRS